ncbi:chemotaxis protein CheW [Grimontia kaedaensis]|uniref:Chemotaxis protein CheW n=1 Tax=Grimontia kaedaensis TaxID=2872157 RepID=A0ABY4WWT2_9GAMM|nr:chemotaxis protein CheW [Grimontia kaedaensis]USH03210.1 chemotaxis protein CheW [Grimontia kaedaensis]
MKDSRALSSVQALDDYFDALLEEDYFSQQHDTDVTPQAEEECVSLEPQPVVMEPVEKFSGATLTKDKRDLSSVEKLLSQLKLDDDMEVEVEESTETEVIVSSEQAVETYTEAPTETATEVETETVSETDTATAAAVGVEVSVETDVETTVEVEAVVEPVFETIVETHVEADVQAMVEEAVEAEVVAEPEVVVATEKTVTEEVTDSVDTEIETASEPETQADEDIAPPWQNIASEYAFQVLFFESFGVTYAVPLAELGGIHKLEDCNHLIGRPDWYLGLQTERDQQLDVVDTAKWVMPEKIADNSHRDDYSYIVILGDSKWGLACDALLGTESLNGEQVRWREQAGKRPWLAGLVKQKMCALIHVEALIAMLNQGIDANALA